jgi:GTP-binding protein YchF
MSLSIAIVGLPNVGKSTLFNALTNNDVLAANYPFATIEPNTGIVAVPDARLQVLANMYQSKKVIPATVTFVDIAGLVAGASQGEGLGNKFLANIRQCDAIVHIVRAFENNDVVHVADRVDPKADIDIINTELMLADIQTIETRLPKVIKEAKANPKAKAAADYLQTLLDHLNAGTPLSAIPD